MKSKWIIAGIAIILILGLSGCGCFKGSSGTNNLQAQATSTTVQDQQPLFTVTPTGIAVENTPESTQTTVHATQSPSPTAPAAAVATQPVDNPELKQAVNDLSDSLNSLSKDLNSTDTMDDVK